MADNSLAVAGMEPVEPAAITGAAGRVRRSRSASASSRPARCAAGFERPRSASSAGQALVTISRNSSVTCHQPANSPGTIRSRADQSAFAVSTSSIRSARSRASHIASAADTGTTSSSWKRDATCAGMCLRQAWTSGASSRMRSRPAIGGAWSGAGSACESSRSRSSSNSPSGRIVGRIAERPPARSTKVLRNSRAARRVGT